MKIGDQPAFPIGITATGIDERTDLSEVSKFPGEIGILLSLSQDGCNRYPRLEWIREAVKILPRVALHVCGARARAITFDGQILDITDRCQRIQVNGTIRTSELEAFCDRFRSKQIITQYRSHSENGRQVDCDRANHQILCDLSGGRGILPPAWYKPITAKRVGFAGGLTPANVRGEILKIKTVAAGIFWVDSESGLRENDWFSIHLMREYQWQVEYDDAIIARMEGEGK